MPLRRATYVIDRSLLHYQRNFLSLQVRNAAAGYCVDGSTDHKNYHKPVIGYPCHSQGGNQVGDAMKFETKATKPSLLVLHVE